MSKARYVFKKAELASCLRKNTKLLESNTLCFYIHYVSRICSEGDRVTNILEFFGLTVYGSSFS